MSDETTGGAPSVPPEREPGDPEEDATHEQGVDAKEADAAAEEERVDAAPREVP